MAKLMIVDDSDFMCNLLTKVVATAGHEVVSVSSGEELLEKYSDIKPDVVFLDILMPGMKGNETLSKLMEMDKDAKVIICSSMGGQEAVARESFDLGAKAIIGKPFSVPEVMNALDKCLN